MTEKDTASMTTVQMKADYAASEVYSTASEPPPLGFFHFNPQQAYKRQSNSVKIAKITAFTIIVSSFILGAFILASSYLQAKASCDQVQALDSVLEKELMLETLQQVNKELPRAEALLGRENVNDDDLQSLNKIETVKKVESKPNKASPSEEEFNMNKINSDSEEAEVMQKYPGKIPLELDLSDLAAALLQNNKKSRMNCVVERKHAEELVDSPSKTVALPFGMNLTTEPKKARITGERISIFCESGNESKEQDSSKSSRSEDDDDDSDEDVESIRPMFFPFQRVPIPFGPIPNRFPLTHMPQRMEPMMQRHQPEQLPGFLRQMPPPPPPFQQLPMRPPMPPQVMQAPHPEPQRVLRIQVHQIPLRELIHVADDVPQQIQSQQPPHQAPLPQQQQQTQQQAENQQQQDRPQMPFFQIQRMPLDLALERAGITAEDLANIQRMTEDRINEEFRRLATDSDEEDNSNSSEDEEEPREATSTSDQEKSQQQDSQQSEQDSEQQQRQARMQAMPIQRLILQPLPEQPRDTMIPPMPDRRMPMGHPGWGRSLAQPVSIPVPMMDGHNDMSGQNDDSSSSSSAADESERPHFVHPRSV
ncbi:msr-110 isoform X1 [Haematobia irritans]|uniref:msr-110 isoform X1 n=2 Tax=Haematobia irritans TaxID=7368 RepID=UPI003F4F6556